MKKITFSFDIGYASIGWAVLSAEENQMDKPTVEGTGVVIFEADSCLASKRRNYRRLRRTIRSRRKRIERVGRILEHHGVITAEQRLQPGHPAPFFLAARALQGKQALSGEDVWQLMRWYAHNRGYDGNRLWLSGEHGDDDDDTAKVMAAKAAMEEHRTATMAETIVAILGLDTTKPQAELNVNSPSYRSMNMAFPREVVCKEVEKLLKLSSLPGNVVDLIISPAQEQRAALAECQVKFPLRYDGSVLFGQLKPRFDNRIIARCPITWANVYQEELDNGKTEKEARKAADKYAKVPNADCPEFYEYRFARILANLRLEGQPIAAETRQALLNQAREVGRFTKTEFIKAFETLVNSKSHNLRNYFQITPDADKALVIVPQKDEQRASGRAPYARPVLQAVVDEVLRGQDPTKPAFSLQHPEGEKKDADGILYAVADPNSDVNKLLATRTIEQQTNNHMVRHRLLIFERLLGDMVKNYAGGDPSKVTQCTVEVGRELKEFSGKTAKEIEKELSQKLYSFHAAVKYLEKNKDALPSGTAITGGLIRKCRIAMDMDWKCPYTGMTYSLKELPDMDREHIVPHAARNTNAMAALVLTWPEVNKMKGRRTGVEFIREFQTQPVAGKENLSILTEKRYKDLVEKLKVKGSRDDQHRCKARKRLLLVEKTPQQGDAEGLGFTEGMMTQSSQLMRLASQIAKRRLHGVKVAMIPGFVTAETRKSWNLMGALVKACPEVLNEETGRLKDKESIRGITHLHHAVDACTLGLILHLIPGGTNGIVWQAIGKRRLNETQLKILKQQKALSCFNVDADRCLHLKEVPHKILDSIASRLAEGRVVRHVPADMSGAHFEEQYHGVIKVENNFALLRSRGEGANKLVPVSKLVGLASDSKLKPIKAALVVSGNYGVALDPDPVVIPHVSVYKTLKKLQAANNGKPVRIIRPGQLILLKHHKEQKRNGVWRVASVKNNRSGVALDLQSPIAAMSASQTNPRNWINVGLSMLMKSGLVILPTDYTSCPQ